jgi:non-specific serine/threonine protein kinase/serine/threonine-protein kinase
MEPGEYAGTVIGRYRLLQKIGEGGMGEVWLAEQKEPVRLRVALKLVKPGMNTREVIARFESERQALALMAHPAIAKVFDAGSTPQGAPYFVMEYVAGIPITAYSDSHRLSTRARLELFLHVCEGVQHAPSESHHPPRSEALQHSRDRRGWKSGTEDYRFQSGQSAEP